MFEHYPLISVCDFDLPQRQMTNFIIEKPSVPALRIAGSDCFGAAHRLLRGVFTYHSYLWHSMTCLAHSHEVRLLAIRPSPRSSLLMRLRLRRRMALKLINRKTYFPQRVQESPMRIMPDICHPANQKKKDVLYHSDFGPIRAIIFR